MMNNLLKPRTWLRATSSRLAAFLLAAFAASCAWAATLSYSGYVSTDSANPSTVFSGVRLVDIGSTFIITGNIGGGHVANAGVATLYESSLSGNVLTVEFRILDTGSDSITYMKSVTLKLSEDSSGNVTAYASSSGFTQTTDITADIANTKTPVDSSNGNGYGIYDIALVPNVKSPVASYDENFPSANATISTSLGNVTFYPKNGASVANGIITLSTAAGQTGPAFAFPASAYVAAIFTADFSGVTLDANQVLFATGNANKNFWTGAKLKSDGNEGFYASGLWGGTNDGSEWTTDDDSSNLLSFSGEHTFLITYDSSEGANKGTHLYVLEGNAVKHVYGKTDSNGLKSGSITKLAIGGGYGSLSGLSRIGGLEIKSCALFLSSSSLPVTPTTFATYANSVSVASDAIISISDLNASAPCVVNVTAGATVNVDAEPSSSIVWGGAFVMDGQYVISEGVTVNLKSTGKARAHYAKVTDTFAAIEDGASLVLAGDTANTGSIPVTLPAGANADDLNVTVVRKDGGHCQGTWDSANNAYTYYNTINTAICGSSTGLDYTFTNTTTAAYFNGTEYLNNDAPFVFNNTYADKTTGLYARAYPYAESANIKTYIQNHSDALTLVVVATAPETTNTQFMHMGRSNDGHVGILFSTGTEANKIVISYNKGKVVYPITTMTVPNAATARHVYAITKHDFTNANSEEKTTFVVYLDGTPWKSLTIDKLAFTNNSGIQCGSDFGGQIHQYAEDANGNSVKALYKRIASNDTSSVLNAIRLFGSVLDESTIKGFSASDEYPYNSPYGDSERAFAADGNWVETASTPWTVKPNGGAEAVSGSPLDGSNIKISSSVAAGATVSVNLDADNTYEALTITGDPMAFEFAEGKTGVIKATGAITIGAETTIKAGALEVGGATTILDNGVAKLIFDYSDYDASGVTVANPQLTPLVLASMDEQEEGKVTCTVPTTPHRVYSFGYANGGYNLSITAKQATLTRSGASFDVDTFAEIFASAENYAIGDTIGINEDVAIANLAVEKDITLDLGANNLTVTGEITGSGAITLTGTGTLTVPVGTTFQNITSASTKIAVSGTVAKGTTLFTVGSGAYTPERVGTSTYGDVHYTLNSETGAYIVGKTFYWDTKTAAGSYINIADTAYWQDSDGNEMGETPLALDVAVFDKSEAYVYLSRGVIPYSIHVKANTVFRMQNAGGYNNHAYAIIGYQNLPNGAIQPEFTVDDDVTATLSTYSGSSNYRDQTYEIYATLKGKGRISCPTSVNATNQNAVDNGVNFHGDNSAFAGQVDISSSVGRHYGNVSSASRDNSLSIWRVDIDGEPQSNSCFFSADTTYKFGALNLKIAGNPPRNVIVEIGETLDEDSSIYGNWRQKNSLYGGTVKWLAPTAKFTQAVKNAYRVTLAGGGEVYVVASSTENAANEFIPIQLNFTDNGGYLTIDDDNAAIAEGIIGAINTTTAGVGLNVGTTEALSVAAPTALQSGVSFNKKGGGEIALTGITSLGTVNVAKGAGALVTPKVDTYTLGSKTGVTVGEDTLTFYHAAAKIGDTYYTAVEAAFADLMSDRSAVAVVLDDTFEVDNSTATVLTQNGIIWDSTARTLYWAAVKDGDNLYATIVAAIDAGITDITVYKNVSEDVTLPVGVTIRPGTYNNVTYTLTGTVTAADGAVLGLVNGVYTAYANTTTATWTGAADNNWSNASNWQLGFAPTSTTPVSFPANENDWLVYIDVNNASCGGMDVAGTVEFAQTGRSVDVHNVVFINGNVTGSSGTVKLTHVGLDNSSGGTITFAPALEVMAPTANPNSDSWLNNSAFTLNGKVTLRGRLCPYATAHTFNGGIDIEEGGTLDNRFNAQNFNSVINVSGTFTSTINGQTFGNTINVEAGGSFTATQDQFLDGGTLTLNGGTASVGSAPQSSAKWLKVQNGATINLNGGTLSVCRITSNSSGTAATINFNGGTLQEYGAGSFMEKIIGAVTYDVGTITLNIKAGGAVIDTGIDTAIAYELAEDSESTGGGLTKTGSGTLTLSATPTFTGAITVEGGSVVVPLAADVTLGGETYVSVEDGTTKTLSKHPGYAADSDGTAGDETVAVPLSWVKSNVAGFAGMTEEQIVTALAANSATLQANGYNYFTCYALGLDPADADDKPLVSVSVDANGNFVVTLTDKDGTALTTASNVTVIPSFYKYNPSTRTYSASPVSSTIAPADVVGEDNVGYIRAKIDVSAE